MDGVIRVAPGIEIPGEEVATEFSRSSGPGGQHVNKTETRVTLRFDLQHSPSLSDAARARIVERLQPRLTRNGEILIHSDRFRDRRRNLEDARERLEMLLRTAYDRPPPRRETKPTKGSKTRRLAEKRRRGERKRNRRPPPQDD